jgi:hypothetical protein
MHGMRKTPSCLNTILQTPPYPTHPQMRNLSFYTVGLSMTSLAYGLAIKEFEDYSKGLKNFGIFKWDCLKLSKTVNYLDMPTPIQHKKIQTKAYQKVGNPYLYINPHSAHPPGMKKGVIFGVLRC